MARVLHWTAQGLWDTTVNRSLPLTGWTQLSNNCTIAAAPNIVGPEDSPVYSCTAPAAGTLDRRDRGNSYATTDGPASPSNAVWTASCWVLGYGNTIGKTFALDIGDVVQAAVPLSNVWQLVTCTGNPSGANAYTFVDWNLGAVAAGDTFYMTQPQVEQRAWRTRLVVPAPNTIATTRDSTLRTSYVGDESGNGRTGAIAMSTAPMWRQDGPTGSCWAFDGTTHIITGPDYGNPANLTVMGWFKYRGGGTLEDYHVVFSKGFINVQLGVYGDAMYSGLYVSGVRKNFASGSGLKDGKWHHIAMTYDGTTLRAYLDGTESGNMSAPGTAGGTGTCAVGRMSDATYSTNGWIADVQVHDAALTPAQIRDQAKVKARITSAEEFRTGQLIETVGTYTPAPPDYSTWRLGTTGSETTFPVNGAAAANSRIIDTNPWGRPDIVWHSVSDGTNEANGGFNCSLHSPIDTTKAYRFSVWVRRKVSDFTAASGYFYLGVNAYDAAQANIGVNLSTSGANNTNPYFHAGYYQAAYIGNIYEWRLLVGWLYPVGTAVGTALHASNGTYTTSGMVSQIGSSFIMVAGTVYLRLRSYLYYSTNVGTTQQFYRPRMDKIDGTEPSIASLLKGNEAPDLYTERRLARIDRDSVASFADFSEAGSGKASMIKTTAAGAAAVRLQAVTMREAGIL